MRVRDLNWMQLAEYLERDDRIVLPIASTEQHGYLSLETDNILAQRVAEEAAEPLGVPVLPVLAYGVTIPAAGFVRDWATAHPDAQAIFHSWFCGPKVAVVADEIDATYSHANW